MTTAEKEEDYSDYIKHLSNMGSMYAFLSGFMFTAITIVLTRLPDPTVLMAQCVLLFMGTMLSVFIFYMGNFFMAVVPLCKSRPSYSGQKSIFNIFSDVSILLGLSGSVVLLFLLWNLVYLALAQLIVWVFFAILTYRSLFKPFYRRRSGS
jgi:hypothetical protein